MIAPSLCMMPHIPDKSGKLLPDKYRFLLFDGRREVVV